MTNFLFVFGNSPDLALEELASVWPRYEISGGLVKIAEIFPGAIVDKLVENHQPGQRVIFGLSGDITTTKTKEIKQELEERGFKARFVLPKDGVELSSVVVAKQKVSEIYLIAGLQAKTIWVQDFEDWNRRDYGRPAVDPHVGMLPPKVARMMVNIGANGEKNSGQPKKTVLDPFCGVGTILAEALMLGYDVIGVDISRRQIEKSKRNLEWLVSTYRLPTTNYQLLIANAREVSQKLAPRSVDAVVTETYLGPDDRKFLENLYLDSLEDWRKVLKPGGRVVIATPFPLDSQKLMGYSLQAGPFVYSRPQAKVKRFIHIYGTH